MQWAFAGGPLSPASKQRSQCTLRASVQAHTRPLPLKLTTDFCVSTSNSPSAQAQPQWEPLGVRCSTWLRSSPAFQSDTACLLSAQRALRKSHVWEDVLCVWRPKIDVLQSLSAPLRAQDTRPAFIQVLDSGDTEWLDWLGREKHNYGHLLRVTIPRNPAFLAVKATLKDLAAYSADFVPPEALDTLYLLSWAATIAPFDMLTAEQLLMAAASDDGALQAARILSRKQRGGDLTFATARHVLVQNVCRAITRAVKQAKEGLLISSIVQRFLLDLSASAPSASPWQVASPAALHGYHGSPTAGSVGQDEWKTSWPCPHHAHHGQDQSR